MENINYFFSTEITEALGWTVLHSLWQSGLIAALLLLCFVLLKKASAQLRYRLAGLAMLSVLLTSVATFFYILKGNNTQGNSVTILENNLAAVTPVTVDLNETIVSTAFFADYFEQHLALIVGIWLVGMGVFLLRLMGGLAYVHYLKNNKIGKVTDYWQQKVNVLCEKIPVKKTVKVLESSLVKMPMTIGYLKPVILLPFGLINHLSIEQTEAVLAHELAHIARKDYLFNLLQSVMEVLYYFNPAVWFISAQIRRERENCCDDIAVRLCGNSLNYVKALVSVETISQQLPQLALAFSNNKNHLLMRVQRILNQPRKKSRLGEKFLAGVFIMTTFAFVAFQPKEVINIESFSVPEVGVETETSQATTAKITENTIATPSFDEKIEDKIAIISLPKDTIPKRSISEEKVTFRTIKEGKETVLELVNGEVKGLMIDEKVINPKHYSKYQSEIDAIMEEANNVPAPPGIGEIPPPPSPPAPGFDLDRIAPPAPPSPPAPPAPPVKEAMKSGVKQGSTTQQMRGENAEARQVQYEIETEEKMQQMQEEMRVKEEEMRAKGEEMRAKGEEMRAKGEEMRAKREEMKAISEQEKAHANQMEAMHVQESKRQEVESKTAGLEMELEKDGLYNDGSYRFKLTDKELKINGKKQSKTMHEKYLKVCRGENANLVGKFNFEINRSKNSSSRTITIEN